MALPAARPAKPNIHLHVPGAHGIPASSPEPRSGWRSASPVTCGCWAMGSPGVGLAPAHTMGLGLRAGTEDTQSLQRAERALGPHPAQCAAGTRRLEPWHCTGVTKTRNRVDSGRSPRNNSGP